MKRSLISLLVVTAILTACNNDKPKDNTPKDGTGQLVIDPHKAQDLQQLKEELRDTPPLSPDALKALLPGELMGVTASNAEVDGAMGAQVASADYKINDSADLQLEIIDCAGPGGAGVFGMQYINMINVNSDDESEYVKTIELNGVKAFENCKKNRNRCTLIWFSGKRFLVSLRGDNVGIGLLKDIAKSLDLK